MIRIIEVRSCNIITQFFFPNLHILAYFGEKWYTISCSFLLGQAHYWMVLEQAPKI